MIFIYLLIIALFLHYNHLFFNYFNNKYKLNNRQKSFLLSFKTSFVMSIISLYFNYQYFFKNNDAQNSSHLEVFSIFFILYFTSYLVSDLVIGYQHYKNQIQLLSGYIHHISYFFISLLSIYIGKSQYFLIYMLLEIPTFILGLGSIWKHLRSDYIFGILFFLLRICFHIFLIFVFRQHYIFTFIGSIALILHCYWFYNWYKKYAGFRPRTTKTLG